MPKAAATPSDDRSESEFSQSNSVSDRDETEERFDAIEFEEWAEEEQYEELTAYDKRYDDLASAATRIQSVIKQIERIDEEAEQVFGDWKTQRP